MKEPIPLYREKIERFERLMRDNAAHADVRLAEDKWTLKEMVGHLIDSASNNHQGFMRLQFDRETALPGYDAEEWKTISQVGGMGYDFLIRFWKAYNEFLLHLIATAKEEARENYWLTPGGEKKTLGFLVGDYYRHMDFHYDLFVERVAEIKSARP